MSGRSRLRHWAQLIRLPNTFTVIADVTAGFLLIGHGADPLARLCMVLLAGLSFYWSGMILNDWFDVEKDRRERPGRPLPSGEIGINQAGRAGWGLLTLGIILASIAGYLPSENWESTWRPTLVACLLAITIVAYDGPLKQTALAPLLMGFCRFLSFLLGASVLLTGPLQSWSDFAPGHVLIFACGMGVYVMGVTNMARHEADGDGRSATLPIGLIVAMLGAYLLTLAPVAAPPDEPWRVSPERGFPLLIGLIAFGVFFRGVRVMLAPDAHALQMLIRIAVLTIIPFSAAIAFLASGIGWGLAIFSLVVPAILLSIWFRVT